MRHRVGVRRRDGDQPGDRQAVGVAAGRDEVATLSGSTPAFCGSRPVLTWTNSQGGAARLHPAASRRGAGRSRLWMASNSSIARVTLFDLQRADQVKLDPAKVLRQRRPLALRLLHPVLAEDRWPAPTRPDALAPAGASKPRPG